MKVKNFQIHTDSDGILKARMEVNYCLPIKDTLDEMVAPLRAKTEEAVRLFEQMVASVADKLEA